MIELNDEFHNRLETALSGRNMKPVDLAQRTKISEATISQYRSGYAKPKDKRLALIASVLRVNPAWLMGMNVPMDTASASLKPLSHEERELLEAYDAASPDTQAAVRAVLGLSLKKDAHILDA